MNPVAQRVALCAALWLVGTPGCDRAEDQDAPPGGPTTAPLELHETATPGERYTIAEVATLETSMPSPPPDGDDDAPELELVHEVEIGKHIEVEIVQVAPDGRPVRYRKRFVHFRQRNTTRLADAPPRTDAAAHPVEGHTVEYVYRDTADGDGRWQVRWIEGPGGRAPDALPEPMGGREHPWLPDGPVRPGDTWQTHALPFSLPGVDDDDVVATLALDHVERTDQGTRVAHVAIAVDIRGEDTAGRLDGVYRFQLPDPRDDVPGRMLRVQLAGRIEQPAPGDDDEAPPVTVEMVVYRAVE